MHRLILLPLFTLAVFVSFAQEFSLFEAQQYALANTEKIKRAELELDKAKKQVVETRAIGLPQISSSFNFQNFLNIPVQVIEGFPGTPPGELTAFRFGTDYNASAGVTVNQLIFDGSYIVGLQVSKFYTEFVSGNIEKNQQEILFDVTQAYELALIARENKVFMDELVDATEQLLEQQNILFETGLIAEEDVDQINFSLLQAKTNQSAAKFSYENAIALVKMTMAYPMDEEIKLTDNLNDLVEDLFNLQSTTGSIQENIDLDLLKKRKALSEYELKNTRYANLPSLSTFFNHQYNYFSNDFDIFDTSKEWFDQTVVGLQVSIPIFSSGQRWAKTQQAKIEVEQREYEIKELERGLQLQEVQYRNDFQSAREKLLLQEKNVELAQRIYDNSLVKSEIGKESSIIVTQKYNQLVSAQTQYTNAMVEVFQAKLKLDMLYSKLSPKQAKN